MYKAAIPNKTLTRGLESPFFILVLKLGPVIIALVLTRSLLEIQKPELLTQYMQGKRAPKRVMGVVMFAKYYWTTWIPSPDDHLSIIGNI